MSSPGRHIAPHALTRLLGDWRTVSGPLHVRLSRRLAQLLTDGRLASGVRLPAERPLADALDVSRNTVVRAYGTLREAGMLESRRGAGSVTRMGGEAAAAYDAWSGGRPRSPDGLSLMDFTKASPPADQVVIDALEAAAGRAASLLGAQGHYPLGVEALRAAVAERYCQRGLPTSSAQIMITAGAQQALDLLARQLVRNRDAVVVESPTYPGAMDSLRLAGARMVTLDVSATPWDPEAFRRLILHTGATLAFLTPDFQNPTGRLMPPADREQLVAVCRKLGVTLVIDETLAEVRLADAPAPPPLATYDPAHDVITVGSLSKALWAGLRVGWIRGSLPQIAALAVTRTAADLGGAPLEQMAAVELLTDLDRHLDARRPALVRQRDAMVSAVRRSGWGLAPPTGGLSCWVELPSGSSSVLADHVDEHGVVIIPGPRLSADGALDRYVRLPFSFPVPVIDAAIARLHSAWEALGDRGHVPRLRQVV